MALLARVRESFWFVPAVMCLLAAVAAQVLVAVDRSLPERFLEGTGSVLYVVGADGSRDVLGAIAGSMLAVASTTFSITIAVLALTSSSYGPRLVRNFMADRGNQLVLGVYVATYLYTLLVLRSIRTLESGDEDPFVPQLAVNGAVLLAIVSIGVLVWFIHHISDSIQVWTLASKVHGELRAVVDDLHPQQLGDEPQDAPVAVHLLEAARARTPVRPVAAPRPGYVVHLDDAPLLACAVEQDVVVELLVRPGSFVVEGGDLALVRGAADDKSVDLVARAVRCSITLAQARSPRQDVEFAVQQLVEMAVRALSPGTNDPYTAVNALDQLSDGLAALARRKMPSPARVDGDGTVRVIAPRVGLPELIALTVDAVRAYGLDSADVVRRTIEVLARVGVAADVDARREVLVQLDLLVDDYGRSDPHPHDLDRARQEAVRTRVAVGGRGGASPAVTLR